MVLSWDTAQLDTATQLDTAAQLDTAPGLPNLDSCFSLGPGPVSNHRSLPHMGLAA